MSIHTRTKRMTVPQLVAMKGQQKIVSLTAKRNIVQPWIFLPMKRPTIPSSKPSQTPVSSPAISAN